MSTRSDIDVRPQTQLSLRKSLNFCLKGIAYRLFRSSLTLSVVVVAVAFFMVLLSESVIVKSVEKGVRGQILDMRETDLLLANLFQAHSIGALSEKLAAGLKAPARLREVAQVTGLSMDKVKDLAETAKIEQRYLVFFNNLAIGKRVILVKKNRRRDIFTYLRDQDNWENFLTDLANMRSVRLPTKLVGFREFLDGYPSFLTDLNDLRRRWLATVADMRKGLDAITGGKELSAWMATATDDQVEAWRQAVVKHGFILAADTMKRVRESLKVSAWETEITRSLQTPEKRAEWKRVFLKSPVLEEKLMELTDERAAEILGTKFSLAQRAAVSERYARRKHLRDLEAALPVRKPGVPMPRFLDGRQMFLVIISFLVCMVGIANAMLMAITERFREIATMKCLGATDSFILKQFLIEAAIQGIVGGSLGMVIGLLITLVKETLTFGGTVFTFFPGLAVLWCCLFTVAVGVVLAMLASIYPSWAAARMAPMEAMRVE